MKRRVRIERLEIRLKGGTSANAHDLGRSISRSLVMGLHDGVGSRLSGTQRIDRLSEVVVPARSGRTAQIVDEATARVVRRARQTLAASAFAKKEEG